MNKMLMQTRQIDEHFETMSTKQIKTSEGHVWLVGGVGGGGGRH